MPPQPHSRARFVARRTLLVLGVALAAVWAINGLYALGYGWDGGSVLMLERGRLIIIHGSDPANVGDGLMFGREPLGWSLSFVSDASSPSILAIPLWPFALASLGAWLMLCRYHERQRRMEGNLCPRCGYARAGLAPSAPCPECGSPPEPRV